MDFNKRNMQRIDWNTYFYNDLWHIEGEVSEKGKLEGVFLGIFRQSCETSRRLCAPNKK